MTIKTCSNENLMTQINDILINVKCIYFLEI